MSVTVQLLAGEELERARLLLAGIDGGLGKALRRSMPYAVNSIRKNSSKAIRERYDISAAALRESNNANVQYTSKGDNEIVGTVNYSGVKIPLYRYNGSSPKTRTEDKTADRVPVYIAGHWRLMHYSIPSKGHQLKSTAPANFHDAFVLTFKSGHTGIFERTGAMTSADSDQTQELMGSSYPQMIGNENVAEKLAKDASEAFENRMEHEILALLNGWA